MDSLLLIGLSALAGLLGGSFLNVVIARVPRGESIVMPGSHCPACGHVLSAWENVPVLSWIVLGGRCRGCRGPISLRYPLIELLTAAVAGLTMWRAGQPLAAAGAAVGFAGLLALAAIDLDVRRVPVSVLYPTAGLTVVLLGAAAAWDGSGHNLVRAAVGAAVGFGVLRAVHQVAPRGLGYGDVRVAALCGLLLGWQGLAYVVVGLYGAFVLGAGCGVALMVTGRAGRRSTLAFAPYLALATMAVWWFGSPLVAAVHRAIAV